jgi:hypothetical protein
MSRDIPRVAPSVAAVQASGGTGRSIREVNVGGLMLTGRTLPRQAAGSADPYDAMRNYIDQRSLPPANQSTGTPLLRLGAALNRGPSKSANQDRMVDHEVRAELDRRHVPVESVVGAVLLPQMAAQIGMLSMTPLMRQSGMWDELVSDDELDRLDERSAEWFAVLEHSYDQDKAELDHELQVVQWVNVEQTRRTFDEVFRLHEATEQVDLELEGDITQVFPTKIDADIRVLYAMSTRFTNRVTQWLNRLLTDDLNAVILLGSSAAGCVHSVVDILPTGRDGHVDMGPLHQDLALLGSSAAGCVHSVADILPTGRDGHVDMGPLHQDLARRLGHFESASRVVRER